MNATEHYVAVVTATYGAGIEFRLLSSQISRITMELYADTENLVPPDGGCPTDFFKASIERRSVDRADAAAERYERFRKYVLQLSQMVAIHVARGSEYRFVEGILQDEVITIIKLAVDRCWKEANKEEGRQSPVPGSSQ